MSGWMNNCEFFYNFGSILRFKIGDNWGGLVRGIVEYRLVLSVLVFVEEVIFG